MKTATNSMSNCPQCEGELVFPEGLTGETVCKNCGLVTSQPRISQVFTDWTPKWFFNWDDEDSDTLREWLTALRTVTYQLNLPNFPHREEAARIIRSRSDVLLRSQRFGKNKIVAVAALMHLILRKYNEVRPLREVCTTLKLDQRLVMKYTWAMSKMTSMNHIFTARDYLRKFAWQLTSDPTLMQKADELLANMQKEIGGNPVSLAAGAFYFVCQERKMKVSKDKIGQAFHISNRTVYSNERRISRFVSAKGVRT